MNLPQIYTTTLLHPSNRELCWQFLIVPNRSTHNLKQGIELSVIHQFGLKMIRSIKPYVIPFLVASMLESENPDEILSEFIWSLNRETLSDKTSETLKFAEQIVFRQLVPFEHVSLTQESLANICATTVEAGDNTDTMLAESEGHYFLTVIGPDGLVIGGPLKNFSLNIWEKILGWLQGS